MHLHLQLILLVKKKQNKHLVVLVVLKKQKKQMVFLLFIVQDLYPFGLFTLLYQPNCLATYPRRDLGGDRKAPQSNRRTYSSYETGVRGIPTEILCAIAGIFHTSTDYLLGRTSIKEPYK